MKRLLFGLACWARGRHRWGKPHFEHLGGGVYSTAGDRFKTCRTCTTVAPVKSRKKEAK